MTAIKFFKKLVMGALIVSTMASTALADIIDSGTLFLQVGSNSNLTAAAFNITPFDTDLGTLNSVYMHVILTVEGVAQLWTYEASSTINYTANNTLDAVIEMGWGPSAAILSGSQEIFNYAFEYGGDRYRHIRFHRHGIL